MWSPMTANDSAGKLPCTVKPLNKGHLGTQAAVPYSEVVPYWEVRDKTVILCTFTASMMYKTHYGVMK